MEAVLFYLLFIIFILVVNQAGKRKKVILQRCNKSNKVKNIPEMDEIDQMDGREFEFFCASLMKNNGYKNVYVTPGSGDQGADIIAEKAGVKYAIQCKRFHSMLNNKPVQEVSVGRAFYKCDIGVVLTNSYFNENAKAAAVAAGVLLWDRDDLIKLMS